MRALCVSPEDLRVAVVLLRPVWECSPCVILSLLWDPPPGGLPGLGPCPVHPGKSSRALYAHGVSLSALFSPRWVPLSSGAGPPCGVSQASPPLSWHQGCCQGRCTFLKVCAESSCSGGEGEGLRTRSRSDSRVFPHSWSLGLAEASSCWGPARQRPPRTVALLAGWALMGGC